MEKTTPRSSYFVPEPKQPPQTAQVSGRAAVTSLYALMPAAVMTDTVKSNLPFWKKTKCWVLAAPAIGLGAGFVQYLLSVEPSGGSDEPEFEPGVESFVFVLEGTMALSVSEKRFTLNEGGYAYVPPDTVWTVHNDGDDLLTFLWIRKLYEPLRDLKPRLIIANEQNISTVPDQTTPEKYATPLLPTDDLAYDMQCVIFTFRPGTTIPFAETHIMEHGIYMLQGQGVYLLNREWHEVQAGDFIWLRAFCPQAFYAGGPVPTRYLLYKNVNRQFALNRRRDD